MPSSSPKSVGCLTVLVEDEAAEVLPRGLQYVSDLLSHVQRLRLLRGLPLLLRLEPRHQRLVSELRQPRHRSLVSAPRHRSSPRPI